MQMIDHKQLQIKANNRFKKKNTECTKQMYSSDYMPLIEKKVLK